MNFNYLGKNFKAKWRIAWASRDGREDSRTGHYRTALALKYAGAEDVKVFAFEGELLEQAMKQLIQLGVWV